MRLTTFMSPSDLVHGKGHWLMRFFTLADKRFIQLKTALTLAWFDQDGFAQIKPSSDLTASFCKLMSDHEHPVIYNPSQWTLTTSCRLDCAGFHNETRTMRAADDEGIRTVHFLNRKVRKKFIYSTRSVSFSTYCSSRTKLCLRSAALSHCLPPIPGFTKNKVRKMWNTLAYIQSHQYRSNSSDDIRCYRAVIWLKTLLLIHYITIKYEYKKCIFPQHMLKIKNKHKNWLQMLINCFISISSNIDY